MSAPEFTASVQINLAGLVSQLFFELRGITHNVAAGLSASRSLTVESFKLPDTGISLHPIQDVPQDLEASKAAFARWIVGNGLRDAIEAIGRLLEGVRQVLALWDLGTREAPGRFLLGEEWNKSMHADGIAFHRLGLPKKLEYLQSHFGFTLDPNVERQIRSINQLRNCLVHRMGSVTTLDTDADGGLSVHLLRMAVFVSDSDGEREVRLPVLVKAGGTAGVRSVPEIRTFRVGETVDLGVDDFMQLSWTLFVVGRVVAKNVEGHGRAMGVVFSPSAEQIDARLDEELAQTFPASDPLPWCHRAD